MTGAGARSSTPTETRSGRSRSCSATRTPTSPSGRLYGRDCSARSCRSSRSRMLSRPARAFESHSRSRRSRTLRRSTTPTASSPSRRRPSSTPTTGWSTASGAVGRDTSGPTTDDAMTRSEEELRVGKVDQERGRARLRKYVVTEEVQQTVPVRREEVRVEREPITDGNVDDALDGPAISEEEHEVVLHEEQPVVEKRTVPKERVRMDKQSVTDEAQVSEEVRKERIEADGDLDR